MRAYMGTDITRHMTEVVEKDSYKLEIEWYQEDNSKSCTFFRCTAMDQNNKPLSDGIGNIWALCRTRQQAVDCVLKRLEKNNIAPIGA